MYGVDYGGNYGDTRCIEKWSGGREREIVELQHEMFCILGICLCSCCIWIKWLGGQAEGGKQWQQETRISSCDSLSSRHLLTATSNQEKQKPQEETEFNFFS